MYTDENKAQSHPSNQNQPSDSPEMQAFMEMFCRAIKKIADEERQEKSDQSPSNAYIQEIKPKTINLVELFFRILDNLHFVIIAALLCAMLGGFYANNRIVPIYSATSKLYVLNQSDTTLKISDFQVGEQLTMDYQEVFRTWEVHEMVREELNLNYSYSALQSMISISNPEDTRILYITARNSDPKLAADIANAYAKAAKQFIMKTMDTDEPNDFSVALTPGASISQGHSYYIIMGFMLGTVLSCGIIILLFVLDDRPRSPADIAEYTGAPTLAVIPEGKKKNSNHTSKKRTGENNEAFRD